MVTFWLNSASVLAQVNFGTNSASILGIFLAVAGAALYFLRSVRPELSRDQDIFFAAVGLLCGFILIFQGWRLDPILQFGQLLLVGTTVYFAFESIRLRGIATEQAKRSTPIVDRERPVSDRYSYYERKSPYEAEVEADLEPLPYDDYYEEERPRKRIPGSREGRSSRSDYYEEEPPRRIERRRSSDRPETSDRPRKRDRPRPTSRNVERLEESDWDRDTYSTTVDDWEQSLRSQRRRPRSSSDVSTRPETSERETPPRRRRRRPPSNDYSSPSPSPVDDDVMPVDYKPIDQSDEKPDNSANVDDF
ncbi:MAG: Ycf66 family protein [Nostocaceae cyanobacterium]|nr:Ycf66 family protein [Nostocaceae cyanobacterium]